MNKISERRFPVWPHFCHAGANGDIGMVVKGAPALFAFCLVQIGVHLGAILAAGRLLGFTRRDVLIASNANVGGETGSLHLCVSPRRPQHFALALMQALRLKSPQGPQHFALVLMQALRLKALWHPLELLQAASTKIEV